MNLKWVIEYSHTSPNYVKTSKVKKEIESLTSGVIDYIFTKLEKNSDELTLNNVNGILFDLLDELLIMSPTLDNGEFKIRYNKFITVKLIDPVKSIYREIKLNKLLNE